jgi:transcription initiation factor TFIIIB Brf1 subunit/transcription initiation factor TFIIB
MSTTYNKKTFDKLNEATEIFSIEEHVIGRVFTKRITFDLEIMYNSMHEKLKKTKPYIYVSKFILNEYIKELGIKKPKGKVYFKGLVLKVVN